jgi:DNA polymerase-4
MFAILDEFSPLVEPLSVDEAFVDLTGTDRLLGAAEDVARRIKNRIRTDLSLTASIGIAPNKFLAKLASDLKKPDGLVVIEPDQIDTVLLPLPIGKLWGVGAVTGKKLASAGIRTINDLRRSPPATLERVLGNHAEGFLRLAQGSDDRAVVSDRQAKSIGQEQTFVQDIGRPSDVRPVLFQQVEQVGRRLRRHGLQAATLTVKLRYGNFETITRSITLPESTDVTPDLWTATAGLFDRWCENDFRPLRLIGVSASQLQAGAGQLPLFEDSRQQQLKQIDSIADQITIKYGNNAIRRGSGMNRPGSY